MESTELKVEAEGIEAQAKAIVVSDQRSLEGAAAFLLGVKDLSKKITEFFAPLKKKAHEAHKAITTAEGEALAPVTAAERAVKEKLAAYEREQERIREAEQRRQEEEFRRLEEASRLAEAADLEASGHKEEAAALVEQLIVEPPVAPIISISRPAAPKGISYREVFRAEVTDLAALVRAVAEGKVPGNALTVNQSFLDNQARQLGPEMRYPGVVVRRETQVAASAGRGRS